MKKEKKNKEKEVNWFIGSMALLLAGFLIVNLVLLALSKISMMYFWGSIIVIAMIAYWVIPQLREKYS